jgi:hypothetical protein
VDPRLDALFVPDPTKATPYRGVSPHHNGFRGRIKLAGLTHRTPVAPTPEGAAKFIADELDKIYGPGWHWRMHADTRKRRPWRPVRWCAPSVSDPAPAAPRVVYRSPPEPRCDRHPRVFDPGRPQQPQPVECHVPAPAPPWRPPGCRLAAGGCEYRRGGPWKPVGWALEACEWGRPVVLGDHAAGHPAGDWPTVRRVWVFASPGAVRRAYEAWRAELLPRRWGLWAGRCCYR